jgi:hypothetical protein
MKIPGKPNQGSAVVASLWWLLPMATTAACHKAQNGLHHNCHPAAQGHAHTRAHGRADVQRRLQPWLQPRLVVAAGHIATLWLQAEVTCQKNQDLELRCEEQTERRPDAMKVQQQEQQQQQHTFSSITCSRGCSLIFPLPRLPPAAPSLACTYAISGVTTTPDAPELPATRF